MFYVHPDSWGNDPIWLLPWKLTWQWRIHHLKMYFLVKMVIFQCHVSFQGCNIFELGWNHQLDLPFPWLDDDFFLRITKIGHATLDAVVTAFGWHYMFLVGNPRTKPFICHWNPGRGGKIQVIPPNVQFNSWNDWCGELFCNLIRFFLTLRKEKTCPLKTGIISLGNTHLPTNHWFFRGRIRSFSGEYVEEISWNLLHSNSTR